MVYRNAAASYFVTMRQKIHSKVIKGGRFEKVPDQCATLPTLTSVADGQGCQKPGTNLASWFYQVTNPVKSDFKKDSTGMPTKKNDDSLLKDFRAYLEALNRSPRTIDLYILNTGRYLGFIHSRDIESCLDVTFHDIERYQGWLLKQPQYCASSVESYVRSVRVFYKYLVRQNYIISNPADLVDLPKKPHKLPRNVLTEDEMDALLNAPDTDTDKGVLERAILETFYATGIRLTALCNLSLFDCNTQRQEIRVKEKGNKDRILPLTNSASQWLRLYIQTVRPKIIADKNNTNLFVGHKRGRNINPIIIQTFIRDLAKKAGIQKKVSPHAIRATIATHLLKRGCSLFEVQEFLGHSLISTTQRYTRVVPKELQDAINKHHPRNNPISDDEDGD